MQARQLHKDLFSSDLKRECSKTKEPVDELNMLVQELCLKK